MWKNQIPQKIDFIEQSSPGAEEERMDIECDKNWEKECKPLGLNCEQSSPKCQNSEYRKNLIVCFNNCKSYDSCLNKGLWQICTHYKSGEKGRSK